MRLDDVTDPSTPTILVDLRADLDRLPIVPPATGSGWWRVDGSHPGDYRVLLRRTSSSQVLRGTVRLIDPLGRIAQQRIDIEAGEILPAPDLSALTVSSHAGGLIVVSFTSTSPNTPSPIGAYMLRVSAARRSGLGPFPPGRPLRPDFPFPPIVGRTVVVELPLPDIPVVNRIPPGSEPIVLVRQRGTGRDVSYAAVIRVDVRGVSVRLLSPDGRVATQTVVI